MRSDPGTAANLLTEGAIGVAGHGSPRLDGQPRWNMSTGVQLQIMLNPSHHSSELHISIQSFPDVQGRPFCPSDPPPFWR